MAIRTYELRLEGLATPNGQISLRDLIELGTSLQQMATRIARQLLDAERPGPAPDLVDRIGELRLSGLREGSTTLEFVVGDEAALPLIGDEADLFAGRLEETMAAISSNRPPAWASAPIRQSASRVVQSLRDAGAERATWRPGDQRTTPTQIMVVQELDSTAWQVTTEHETENVVVAGRLDLVDLRTRRFRVRDDVGHDVRLEEVVDVGAASRLIGQRVIVTGTADRVEGRLVRIVEPSLLPEQLPAEWASIGVESPPIGSAPPRVGITGVTNEDIEELLREIHA